MRAARFTIVIFHDTRIVEKPSGRRFDEPLLTCPIEQLSFRKQLIIKAAHIGRTIADDGLFGFESRSAALPDHSEDNLDSAWLNPHRKSSSRGQLG
jgi:hypothetical protein